MKSILTTLLFFGILLASGKQNGYINVDSAFQHIPNYVRYEKEMDDLQQQYTDTFTRKSDHIQKVIAEYEKLSTHAQFNAYEVQKEIERLNTDLEEFTKRAQEEMERKQESYYEKVLEELRLEIKKFASINGIAFLVDQNAIFYSKENLFDYTSLFIRFLEENK